jgi:hypothetical protein
MPDLTDVNDLLWFEDEWIFEQLGIDPDEDEDDDEEEDDDDEYDEWDSPEMDIKVDGDRYDFPERF